MAVDKTFLFLAAVGAVVGQYHVYEHGEDQQNVGYDSPLSPTGPPTGTAYGGEGGGHTAYPSLAYVTPLTTSYGEPVRNSYFDPTSHYGSGDYSGASYGGAGLGHVPDQHADRIRIRVYRGPTLKSDYTDYATWGYYVVQPSDNQREDSYGY